MQTQVKLPSVTRIEFVFLRRKTQASTWTVIEVLPIRTKLAWTETTSPTNTGLRKFIASTATVTVRDFVILDAKIPPPISIWLSSQPPKMSPFWLVSDGIAIVRIDRSPQGSVSVFDGA